ncbi:MAG: signal peptidase I [Polyangiales bacterium]|jgi:signal peptidase I
MNGITKFILKAAFGAAVVCGIIGGVMRLFFVTPVLMTHNGMAPSLLAGEQAFMWRGAEPELGSIAVCANQSTGESVIGRVIGTSGNQIATDREQLTINGRSPSMDIHESLQFFNSDTNRQEPVRRATVQFGNTDHDIFIRENHTLRIHPTSVSSGMLYLMSDNRGDETHDSRAFGPVQSSSCIGTLFMRGRPVDVGANLGHGWLDFL